MKNAKKYNFSKDQYLKWYRSMLLIRRFEEKAGQLYGQQKIKGFCHLYIGQEACASGAKSALEKGDKWITAYRDHGHPLVLGSEPKRLMAELFGKETGCSKGNGGSMHLFDKKVNFVGGHGIVGGQIPLGAGLAFAEKYKGTKNLCICFLGDGAIRQGSVHETFNMAMLWKLPVIFIIENNGYAMGTSVERTSNVQELYKIGQSYDMVSEPVDAMQVEEVHLAVDKAAKQIKKGEGPILLEFRTYRYKGHSMSDPAKYRTKEELQEYQNQDPIQQVKATIIEKKFATEEELKTIDKSIRKHILDAVDFAENSAFPNGDKALENIYFEADVPVLTE